MQIIHKYTSIYYIICNNIQIFYCCNNSALATIYSVFRYNILYCIQYVVCANYIIVA
nr:MAG TPA_asm: hypothetical protein [Caudoviricetes sp.]